jgi:hypothetical protein
MSAVPSFNEFGIWYFVFGLFTIFGFVMLGVILLAEPDPQYAIEDIETVPASTETNHESG